MSLKFSNLIQNIFSCSSLLFTIHKPLLILDLIFTNGYACIDNKCGERGRGDIISSSRGSGLKIFNTKFV